MKKLVLALAAVVVSIGSAAAADLAARPYVKAPAPAVVASWTGCYVGLNVGGGWARKENIDAFILPTDSLGSHSATGAVGGGQLGCDYQAGQFVIGIRAMGDAAGLRGSNVIPQNALVTYTTDISAFATVTARAGLLATPNVLLYLQGGGTWLREHHDHLFPTPTLFAAEPQNWAGWTVGVGGEWMFAPRWSVFAEYNYTGFGDRRTCFNGGTCPGFPAGNPGGIIEKLSLSTALVGVNYHFGAQPVVAKY